MSVTYSYKPASGGLEGASTVVPLKAGGFLEVRRGEKTRWAAGEARQTWATLEEWKATLPAGATVTENLGSSGGAPVPMSSWSADFKAALATVKDVSGYMPFDAPVVVDNNRNRAAKLLRSAQRCKARGGRPLQYERYEQAAAAELAAPAFERRICRKYGFPHYWLTVLHAQRISDGEFVPIFFDMKRGVLHTPVMGHPTRYRLCKEGTTFAELGVRPVFMARIRGDTPSFRLISL